MIKKLLITFLILIITPLLKAQTLDATLIELNYLSDCNPKNITKGDTKIYFTANDGTHGTELWVCNNITKTTSMVKDIGLESNGGLDDTSFLIINDILYFIAIDETRQTGLWRSDGTETGTKLIKYINTYYRYSPHVLLNYNGKVAFFTWDDDDVHQSLWITDGTTNGTSLLKTFFNTYWQTISNITIFKNNIIFTAFDDDHGHELWISDGTSNGTKILKDIASEKSSSNPTDFFILNDNLFFSALSIGNGTELWKTDGTENGTFLLKDIYPTFYSGIQPNNRFFAFNNEAYFFAKSSASSYELWKTDGSIAGTKMIKNVATNGNSSNYEMHGGVLKSSFVFSNYNLTSREIWNSDGTPEGTTLIKKIVPEPYSYIKDLDFTLFKDKLYFSAATTTEGDELWATDGSAEGTKLIRDIKTGKPGSGISKLTATSKYLFFSATGNSKDYPSLWISDGTSDGLLLNEDINLSQFSNTELSFVELDNNVFFQGGYNSKNGYELWKTNLLTDKTTIEKDINHSYGSFYDSTEYITFNDKMIYGTTDGFSGTEPYITDGTIEGTKIIKNINAENSSIKISDNSRPFFTIAGQNVFFNASDGKTGFEIYKTDGTPNKTVMIKDIAPGPASSIRDNSFFLSYNNICYFAADDQVHGIELWRTDGTEAGTYMLKDINPGSDSGILASNIYYDKDNLLNEKFYAILNNVLYFSTYDGIWKTDGTTDGTSKVLLTESDDNYTLLNATSNKFFFKTNYWNSGNGTSLWSSDGTKAGTVLLGTWNITGPQQLKKNIIHNNELYFTVYSENGPTLMKSDGTIEGTIPLTGYYFTNSFTFNALKSCGKYAYFNTGDAGSSIGTELWKTDGTVNGTIQLDSATSISDCSCVQDNLFYLKGYYSLSKITYVNDQSSTPVSFDLNVTNAPNFSSNEGILHLLSSGNNLFFAGLTTESGIELYHAKIGKLLGLDDFNHSPSNLTSNHIRISPNPSSSSHRIFISSDDNDTIKNVEIYSILGAKVQSASLDTIMPTSIDLKPLNTGIYLVKITTDNYTETKKLIIR